LLAGEPGTGKTSLIKGIASYFNKNIRYVDNINVIDELSRDLSNDDIIVLEDVDTLENKAIDGLNRDNKVKTINNHHILHKLLNTMDGIHTPDGAIWIMTTNYKEKLDKALTRKGRCDLIIEVERLDFESMKKMFYSFFNTKTDYLNKFESFFVDNVYKEKTGAELQDIFISSLNAEECLNNLIK
jgi:chaperone BCS1